MQSIMKIVFIVVLFETVTPLIHIGGGLSEGIGGALKNAGGNAISHLGGSLGLGGGIGGSLGGSMEGGSGGGIGGSMSGGMGGSSSGGAGAGGPASMKGSGKTEISNHEGQGIFGGAGGSLIDGPRSVLDGVGDGMNGLVDAKLNFDKAIFDTAKHVAHGLGGKTGIGGVAGNMINQAEGIVEGAGDGIKSAVNAKLQLEKNFIDGIKGALGGKNHRNHGRKEGHGHTGKGIDKKSGIGSQDGIRAPINSALGLTSSICDISYAAESGLEKLGKGLLSLNEHIKHFDRVAVNYFIDNIIMKGLDLIRNGQESLIDFLVDTHMAADRLVANAGVEIYRVTKAPLRELFACEEF